MSRLITRASERLLEVVLGSAEAGACVPDNGAFCYCLNHREYRVQCLGGCYRSNTPC